MTRPEAMRLVREDLYYLPARRVRERLAAEGIAVSDRTIVRWQTPEVAEDESIRHVNARRSRRQAQRLFDRIVLLRARGMSHRDIVVALDVYHGVKVSEISVRRWLKVGYISRLTMDRFGR